MSQEKCTTMPMQFFFGGGEGVRGGWWAKEVCWGICASRESSVNTVYMGYYLLQKVTIAAGQNKILAHLICRLSFKIEI